MKPCYSAIVVVAVLAVGWTRVSSAQPQAAVPDVQKLGPQVGQKVPSFRLNDQTGRTRTLQSIMGPKGVILVFFRSADW